MSHKIKIQVPVEKRGFLGFKKTVMETRTVEVDNKTYKKLIKESKKGPFTEEELLYYDIIFDDFD